MNFKKYQFKYIRIILLENKIFHQQLLLDFAVIAGTSVTVLMVPLMVLVYQ